MRTFAGMKIDPSSMLTAADAACDLLKAMASRNRLMLLCQLLDGEKSVGELARALSLREANASQHLALLRKDRLVTTRREAQTIYYALAIGPAREVMETLYRAYCAPKASGLPNDPESGGE